jgi:RNA polymerase subunit RPABC4/transcription elongation factor Spt4
MICQKCGKYNDDGNKFCNYCGATLSEDESTNTPLTGSDRLKIGWLFALLIIPFGGFGMAIIPLLILWSSIYVMKKDKSILPIQNAKKYIKTYLTLLALGWIIGIGMNYYDDNKEVYNMNYSYEPKQNPEYEMIANPNFKFIKNPEYDIKNKQLERDFYGDSHYNCKNYPEWCPEKYMGNGEPQYISNGKPEFLPQEEMYLTNSKVGAETTGVAVASVVGFSIVYALLMFIFNSLFFNILKRHQKWVINNGIFADADTTYSDISCSNCGHKLKSQGGFCPNCGHKG